MNASKKLAALVGVILLSGMIFTGCSGNGQESSQTSSASVSSETETSSVHSQSDFNSADEAESNAQLLQYRQTAVRHPKIIRTLMNTSLKIRLRQLIMRNPVLFIQPTICFR